MKYSEKQKQFSQLAEKIRANPRRTLRMCSKIRNFTGREISFKENYQTKIDWKSSSVSNYKPIKTNPLFQKLQILNISQSQLLPILSETLPCLAPWKGEQKLEGKQFSEENHREGDQNHRVLFLLSCCSSPSSGSSSDENEMLSHPFKPIFLYHPSHSPSHSNRPSPSNFDR